MVHLFTVLTSVGLGIHAALAVVVYGGINYAGSTVCDAGTYCMAWNPYYSQCIPATSTSSSSIQTFSSSRVSSTSSSRIASTSLSSQTNSSNRSIITSVSTASSGTATSSYTGTLPIGTLSPTGLAVAAARKGKYIGSAYDNGYIANTTYSQLLLSQVNAMTPENIMKWDSLEQTQGVFTTSLWADRVVNITQLNHLLLRGHTLVWHSQPPS